MNEKNFLAVSGPHPAATYRSEFFLVVAFMLDNKCHCRSFDVYHHIRKEEFADENKNYGKVLLHAWGFDCP